MRPRAILLLTLSVVLICCGGAVAVATGLWTRAGTDTVGDVDFVRALPVPPLAPSHVDGDGTRVFDLRAEAGRHDFGSGHPAETYGFNGSYLGPTLRAARGERIGVNVHNGLDVTTSVHWHGMHLPAAMDGGPHQPIAPGRTWAPRWRIDQPAATLWYHPHPHGETAGQVYRGLAGMFILDDAGPAAALPHEYGVDDVPVIVQDKNFSRSGELDGGRAAGTDIGILGRQIVVNGALGPYLDVATERVRLRLLNASNARAYSFGLSDDREFALIGTDGGLLDRPWALDRIPLSPGERAEIVVDVRPGERVVLRSYPQSLGGGFLQDRFSGGKDRLDVLELRGAARLRPSPPVPARLATVDRLLPALDGAPPDGVPVRRFRLGGQAINGDKLDMDRIDFAVTLGATEVWEVRNNDGAPHDFHVHDVQFQVLSVGEAAPPPHLTGWKDTVFAEPGRTVRLALRFTDYADPDTPYMYHCHLLTHEDRGMMGQFVVVPPGASRVSPHHHG